MGDVDQEDRARLERLVGAAMEIARERSGLTREDWVRRLRPALRLPDAPPEMKLRNNWYAWRSKPWTVPAVLLLAAATAAGMTLEALMTAAAESLAGGSQHTGHQSELPTPSAEGRLARLEREVAEQQRVIDELREEIDRRSAPASDRDEQRRRARR